MNDNATQTVKDHPDWMLAPQAWADGVAIGYRLTGAGLPEGTLETLQFEDPSGTVVLRWWEQARLYYRSMT